MPSQRAPRYGRRPSPWSALWHELGDHRSRDGYILIEPRGQLEFFVSLAQSAVGAAPSHDPWALGIPALTAIFTATLTLGGGALLARKKDKTAARYLAMRIAVSLEGYAITCAESLSDWDLSRWAATPAA